MVTPGAFVPVAVTSRSGFDESVHSGAVVCLGPSGEVVDSVGDPWVVIYPRSANKPMQATAMVRGGLVLPPRLLALVCASHDGTPAHIAGVREILDSAGLAESQLANTADLPLEPAAHDRVLPRRWIHVADHAELQRQARRDACLLHRQRLADRSRATSIRPTRCSSASPRTSRSWPASRLRTSASTAAARRHTRSR